MAALIRLYNDTPGKSPAAPSTTGTIRLYNDPPAPRPAPSSTPSPAPVATPTTGPSPYGGSFITDQSGKPLLTFRNDEARQSQLLSDRVYGGFDPTKPTKLDSSHLLNGRMPLAVSSKIKDQMGGAYSDELDHKIALELSGSNNKQNLKIEPGRTDGGVSAQHDQLENQLAKKVKNGELSLLDAQRQLANAKGYALKEDGGTLSTDPLVQGKTQVVPSTRAADAATKGFSGTLQAIADLQTNPLSLHTSFKDIVKTPVRDMTEASDRFNQVLASTIRGFQNHEGAASNLSHVLETATAFASSALSPITSMLNAASKVPVAGTAVKLLFNIPFAFAGDVGSDNSALALQKLSDHGIISKETAAKLEPGVREFSALLAQLAAGKAVEVVKGELETRVTPKEADTLISHAKDVIKDSKPEASAPSAPVEMPGKPLPETPKTAPIEQRAGFVNPEAFTDSVKEALAKAKEGQEASKYGEAVRTAFTGERDSRVAETNQLRDSLSKGLSSQEQEATLNDLRSARPSASHHFRKCPLRNRR